MMGMLILNFSSLALIVAEALIGPLKSGWAKALVSL